MTTHAAIGKMLGVVLFLILYFAYYWYRKYKYQRQIQESSEVVQDQEAQTDRERSQNRELFEMAQRMPWREALAQWRLKYPKVYIYLCSVNAQGILSNDPSARNNLQNQDFRGADLRGIYLGQCDFTGSDFTGANCQGVRLGPSTYDGAIFDDADLTGAESESSSFMGARLNGTILTNARMYWARGFTPAQLVACVGIEHAYNMEHLLPSAVTCGYVLMKDRPTA